MSTGNFSKLFRKYLNKISGKQDMKEMQRTAILGTDHILLKVLIEKHKRFVMGNNMYNKF